MNTEPFAHTLGPHNAKIMLVGEAWGNREAQLKKPFVGWSGVELARMCGEAGLAAKFTLSRGSMETQLIGHWSCSKLLLTNVFADHPPDNKLDNWCCKKADLPPEYALPSLTQGRYLRSEYTIHISRLFEEIAQVQPNLIVALGGTAVWALLGSGAITKLRGAVAFSEAANCKVLPTYHPAAVLRQWTLRPIVVMDLLKAKRQMEFPEIRRPERWLLINPTLNDIEEWRLRPATHYAVDIETANKQITMIGFARSKSDAIVIPFVKNNQSYWPTHEEERSAWQLVKTMLEGPQVKIFQNGLYDLSYLVSLGIRPKNCTEDTMLMHHALYPEVQKSLGFMGSIYTDEPAWKLMRERPKDQMLKREE